MLLETKECARVSSNSGGTCNSSDAKAGTADATQATAVAAKLATATTSAEFGGTVVVPVQFACQDLRRSESGLFGPLSVRQESHQKIVNSNLAPATSTSVTDIPTPTQVCAANDLQSGDRAIKCVVASHWHTRVAQETETTQQSL